MPIQLSGTKWKWSSNVTAESTAWTREEVIDSQEATGIHALSIFLQIPGKKSLEEMKGQLAEEKSELDNMKKGIEEKKQEEAEQKANEAEANLKKAEIDDKVAKLQTADALKKAQDADLKSAGTRKGSKTKAKASLAWAVYEKARKEKVEAQNKLKEARIACKKAKKLQGKSAEKLVQIGKESDEEESNEEDGELNKPEKKEKKGSNKPKKKKKKGSK
jgi:hypothetical protein